MEESESVVDGELVTVVVAFERIDGLVTGCLVVVSKPSGSNVDVVMF